MHAPQFRSFPIPERPQSLPTRRTRSTRANCFLRRIGNRCDPASSVASRKRRRNAPASQKEYGRQTRGSRHWGSSGEGGHHAGRAGAGLAAGLAGWRHAPCMGRLEYCTRLTQDQEGTGCECLSAFMLSCSRALVSAWPGWTIAPLLLPLFALLQLVSAEPVRIGSR